MTDAAEVARIAASLTKAQREWFRRGFIRIGNPVRQVPRALPIVPSRTWDALERRGLIEPGRFGKMLTNVGEAVRALIQEEGA